MAPACKRSHRVEARGGEVLLKRTQPDAIFPDQVIAATLPDALYPNGVKEVIDVSLAQARSYVAKSKEPSLVGGEMKLIVRRRISRLLW